MYIEKEKALLRAMDKNDYELFEGNKAEALEFVEEALCKPVDYVNLVARQYASSDTLRFRYEGQALRDEIEKRNDRRIAAHDGCISAFTKLNRLCEMHGLEPFTTVELSDRNAVAAEAGRYVNECYELGIKEMYFDNAVYKAVEKGHDTGHIKERWKTSEEIGRVKEV